MITFKKAEENFKRAKAALQRMGSSERGSDAMQRSCLAAQPSDEPVTDEPPHLADRSEQNAYTELVEEWKAKAATMDKMRDDLPRTADNVDAHKRLSIKAGVYRALAVDLERVARAEAREERPSGRPNDGDHLQGG